MFELKRKEPVAETLRELAVAGLECAITMLTRPGQGGEGALGELERVAAVVELIGPSHGKGFHDYEQGAMGRAMERLARRRTARSALALIKPLGEGYDKSELSAVRKVLRGEVGPNGAPALRRRMALDPVVYRLVADLAEARARAARWPIPEDDAGVLRAGLANLRRRLTRKDRLDSGVCGQLTESLRLIEPCWASGIKPLRKAAQSLTGLSARWAALRRLGELAEPDSALLVWLDKRRAEVERQTNKPLGRLTVEAPAAMGKRLAGYVALWQAG